ncbi:hypothetical protein VAA96_004536 [Salmonella enterica]|nr:hypothetical protein [Salmonella enterica]
MPRCNIGLKQFSIDMPYDYLCQLRKNDVHVYKAPHAKTHTCLFPLDHNLSQLIQNHLQDDISKFIMLKYLELTESYLKDLQGYPSKINWQILESQDSGKEVKFWIDSDVDEYFTTQFPLNMNHVDIITCKLIQLMKHNIDI